MNKYFDHIYVIYIPAREKYIRQVINASKPERAYALARLLFDTSEQNIDKIYNKLIKNNV